MSIETKMPISGAASLEGGPSRLLDLRQVARPMRHPMVFGTFDALEVGESMELINDHDPVPLNMQIDRMRVGQAHWEYVQRGPEIFHIRIRRIDAPADSDVPVKAPPSLTRINHKH